MTDTDLTKTLNTSDQIKKEFKEAKRREKEEIQQKQRQEKIEQHPSFMWSMDFDKSGNPIKSMKNYIELLTKCEDIGQFRYDTYTKRRTYTDRSGNEVEFSDSLYRTFFKWSEQYITPCDEKKCVNAMLSLSDDNSYNSAIAKFESLIWDGVPRVERFFIDTLAAEDNQLVREMTKRWLVGAVQRIYEPGCKNENVLILTGSQGCGKTSSLMWLAGDLGFDNDINLSRSEQETGQKLQQCWFVCFDELATLSKRQSAEYKNWLSIQIDSYRLPYDRLPEKNPRHNVYCGTTNETTFLKDFTDQVERRMWVIQCNRTQQEWSDIYYNTLTDELWEQIWGEAIHIYKTTQNFCPYIPSSMYDQFSIEQRKYKNYDNDITERLLEYLNKPYYLDKNGNFEDVDDMLRQIKGIESTYRSNTTKQYINHLPHSYVSSICTDILHQKRIDHNCMRVALDGKWCVQQKRRRIGGLNTYFYIRGEWVDIKSDTVNERNMIYTDIQSSQSVDSINIDYMINSSNDLIISHFLS